MVVKSETDGWWHIWRHFVCKDLVKKNCAAKQDSVREHLCWSRWAVERRGGCVYEPCEEAGGREGIQFC